MHPGTQAFNADAENARLADDYAISDADRVKEMFEELNIWTNHYNNEILDGKWADFFNWQPYHWFRSEKIEQPVCTPEVLAKVKKAPKPRFLNVDDALAAEGIAIESETEAEIPLWIEALTPIQNFSKEAKDNIFCHIAMGSDSFDASATPINNVWHAPYVGPMWSKVGTLHLKKGENRISITALKADARIDKIYVGEYPPFVKEPRLRMPASLYQSKQGGVERVKNLGFSDGVLVQPFDTPSYQLENLASAPYVEYEFNFEDSDKTLEVRTLPTLRVYEGRDARFAVQIGEAQPQVFSIHTSDFTAEWRRNVLRGYASRSIPVEAVGRQRVRIYFMDLGIVLQEILVNNQ